MSLAVDTNSAHIPTYLESGQEQRCCLWLYACGKANVDCLDSHNILQRLTAGKLFGLDAQRHRLASGNSLLRGCSDPV